MNLGTNTELTHYVITVWNQSNVKDEPIDPACCERHNMSGYYVHSGHSDPRRQKVEGGHLYLHSKLMPA
ncbi:hypothetical protein I79_003109 [Cricetulus griseus]|uniref:Uncharacterized protein n=1 Tax=Cricetulus griseus TaxID=10029 RepID=G3GZ78_CRIGR|nr:hypothetical protein I79_003109 [Cricetulus griseus]